MMRTLFAAALAVLLLAPAYGVETETWRQSSFEDFAQGTRERVALRSDGLLTLSPELKELLDTSADAIWSLAADRKGNVYTAAPSPESEKLRIYRISPDGKAESIAEVDGLACFALAVDAQDRVYAGVSPDARIFRISRGEAELFTALPAAYVWAMAFDSKQNLFAATGDKGVIYRMDAAGKASVFLETEETHVRSLLVDKVDRIYAGTAPGGLLLRVSPSGESFVVYQAAREEITSIALNGSGELFLAAAGAKRGTGLRSTPAPAQPVVPPAPAPAQTAAAGQPPPPRPAPAVARPVAAGGSDVIHIGSDGFPETVWESDRDIVYALAVDAANRVVLGTGNEGGLVRLEGDRLYTSLLEARAEQITALLPMPDGAVVFSTANIGKVHKAGPAPAQTGTFESDVFDSGFFARWGKLSVEGKAAGDSVAVQARSGNVNRPQKNWSAWSSAVPAGIGIDVNVPAARYVQWRTELKRPETSGSGSGPEVRAVELAYRSRNFPPRITATEATPPNYTFPPRLLAMTPSDKLTLQPLSGKARPRPATLPLSGAGAISMNYSKGYVGIRWTAEDANGDDLSYALEIRSAGTSNWLQLVKDLEEPQYTWDSNAWPDGRYEVRITVSDRKSNVPEEALEGTATTDFFTIDNTKPRVEALAAKRVGSGVEVTWSAIDERSPVRKAYYSVNGGDWIRIEPQTGLSDASSLRYSLRVPEAEAAPGNVVAVRVADEFDNEAVASILLPAR
ncbi:MAG: hypothetical protein IT169_04800 [Bryobacterales bacterium]|nr:hypothetical protein [Bryobacterales bacterium]